MPVHVDTEGRVTVLAPNPQPAPIAMETLQWRPMSQSPPEGAELVVAYACSSPSCARVHHCVTPWTQVGGFMALAVAAGLLPVKPELLAWAQLRGPFDSPPEVKL